MNKYLFYLKDYNLGLKNEIKKLPMKTNLLLSVVPINKKKIKGRNLQIPPRNYQWIRQRERENLILIEFSIGWADVEASQPVG